MASQYLLHYVTDIMMYCHMPHICEVTLFCFLLLLLSYNYYYGE